MAHFQPLDPKVDSFRLVKLLPSQKGSGDVIQCELQVNTLASKPKYEAISYTGSHETPSKPIQLDGKELLVRPIIYHALSTFQSNKPRLLWIDSLCINLEDKEERNDQASMMSYIYSRAERMLAFLGPEKEHYPKGTLSRIEDGFYTFSEPNAKAINNSPYWKRRWIIQELILAKQIRFHLGKGYFTLDTYINGLSYVSSEMEYLRNQLDLLTHHRRYLHSELQHLETLLDMYKGMDCYDTRDQIFSFMGLAEDHAQALIEVDYNMDYYELYDKLIEYHQTGPPKPLRANLFPHQWFDLGPWRETWKGIHKDVERSVRIISFSHTVQTALKGMVGKTPIPSSLQERDPIIARGVCVGQVLHVGPTYNEFISSWAPNKEWKMVLERRFKNDRNLVQLRKADAKFSRDMIKFNENELSAIQDVDSAHSYGFRNGHDDIPITRNDGALSSTATGPRRFLGTDGLMGFLPPGSKEGDSIYSFWQSLVGIVVRQVGDDRWMIVGRTTLSKESITPMVEKSYYYDAINYGTENPEYHMRQGTGLGQKMQKEAFERKLDFRLDIPTLQRLTC